MLSPVPVPASHPVLSAAWRGCAPWNIQDERGHSDNTRCNFPMTASSLHRWDKPAGGLPWPCRDGMGVNSPGCPFAHTQKARVGPQNLYRSCLPVSRCEYVSVKSRTCQNHPSYGRHYATARPVHRPSRGSGKPVSLNSHWIPGKPLSHGDGIH